MVKKTTLLKDLQHNKKLQQAIEFSGEAIDTLAEVSKRLQIAFHDLIQDQPKKRRRKTTKKRTTR